MTNRQARRIEVQIDQLRFALSDSTSKIGDWKGVKQAEYIARGLTAPYTDEEMTEYYTARQTARDKISELEAAESEGLTEDE